MTCRRILLLGFIAVVAAGCTVGPDYRRPEVSIPEAYRGAELQSAKMGAASFGELAWVSVFPDPDLQALIRTALEQNYDLRVAASRILQAQSQVTIVRSQQFPTVDGSITAPYASYPGDQPGQVFPDPRGFPPAGESLGAGG